MSNSIHNKVDSSVETKPKQTTGPKSILKKRPPLPTHPDDANTSAPHPKRYEERNYWK